MIEQLLSWVFTWRKKKILIIHDIYNSSFESFFIIYYGKKSESISLSVLSDSLCAHQAPLSVEFSSQEYQSGLSFPSPGDLPDPGIEPMSPAFQADSVPSEPPGKHQ